MKKEHKNKIKKGLKIAGLISLIALASWGAFSAVLLAVGAGNKKEESSLRSPVVYQSPKMEDKEKVFSLDDKKPFDENLLKSGASTRASGTSLSAGWYYARNNPNVTMPSLGAFSLSATGFIKNHNNNAQYSFYGYQYNVGYLQFFTSSANVWSDSFILYNDSWTAEYYIGGVLQHFDNFGRGSYSLYFDNANGDDLAMNYVRHYFSAYESITTYDIGLNLTDCHYHSGRFVDYNPSSHLYGTLSIEAESGFNFSGHNTSINGAQVIYAPTYSTDYKVRNVNLIVNSVNASYISRPWMDVWDMYMRNNAYSVSTSPVTSIWFYNKDYVTTFTPVLGSTFSAYPPSIDGARIQEYEVLNDGTGVLHWRISEETTGVYIGWYSSASVPVSTFQFPDSWSPFLPVTDELTSNSGYGYLKLPESSSGTMVSFHIDLTDVVFRYGGKVYDTISFYYEDLSYGIGYIRDDGTPYLPAVADLMPSDVRIIGVSVNFSNSQNGEVVNAVSPVYDSTPFGEPNDTYYPYPYYLPNGSYRWALKDSTIEVLYEKNAVATGRYNGRYSNYTDLEFLRAMSSYSSTALVVTLGDNGTYNVFSLFTSAFEGMLPLLSVSIIPGISFGLLLMLPLIAGIIVLVIKVVKK